MFHLSESSYYSSAITCFVYPSANRTLLLQERTSHLRARPVETHVYPNCFSSSLFFCFDRHFEFSSGLPLYTSSQTPVPGSPLPVPHSPFVVLVTSTLQLAVEFGILGKARNADVNELQYQSLSGIPLLLD